MYTVCLYILYVYIYVYVFNIGIHYCVAVTRTLFRDRATIHQHQKNPRYVTDYIICIKLLITVTIYMCTLCILLHIGINFPNFPKSNNFTIPECMKIRNQSLFYLFMNLYLLMSYYLFP